MALLDQEYRTTAQWTTFFTAVGIPDDDAAKYAESFATESMTETEFPSMSRELLKELSICTL